MAYRLNTDPMIEQLITQAFQNQAAGTTVNSTAATFSDILSGDTGVAAPESVTEQAATTSTTTSATQTRSQLAQVDTQVTIPEFTIQAYTPGTDTAIGWQRNQIIWGREGNDDVFGFDRFAAGQQQIDLLIGDVPIITSPTPRNYNNSFILGDWRQPYYASAGLNDFATILDFDPNADTIQLYGTAQNYRLSQTIAGTDIYFQQGTTSDLIAFLPAVYDVKLTDGYFQYKGTTPPPGPVLGQTEQLGAANFDLSVTTAKDAAGNVFTAGTTNSDLYGPNAGARDAFLTKYDGNGNQLWSRQFGTPSPDSVFGIDTDRQGNVYLSGYTQGNLGGTRQGSFSDAFLAKYDANGNQVWIRQFGTDITNLSFDIDVDDNGNVYASGLTVKASPQGAIFPSTDDYWVTKYDTNGNRQWFRSYGSPYDPNTFNFDEAYGVALAGDGSVFASGWTTANLGGQNAGFYDAWISKLDNSGNLQWTRQIGSPDYEFSWGTAADSKGNGYAIGWTLGNLGGTNAGSYDAWIAKYDGSGNQAWIRQFGTSGDDEAFGVAVDPNDNIFVTGYTNGSLEGTNAGSYDAWVAKYDSAGNRLWIQQFGTSEVDQGLRIALDNTGTIAVTGVTKGSFGANNAGSFDGWVAELDSQAGNLLSFSGGTPT